MKTNKTNKRKLKIAVFCANEFAVPPSPKMKDIYAPLWLTHYITEELVKRGHNVTLFASSDSKTKAKLISNNLTSLRASKETKKFYKQVTEIESRQFYRKLVERKGIVENYEYLLISKLYQTALAKKFDIIYVSLIGLRPLPFAALCQTPTVFTLHNPLGSFNKFFFSEYKKRYPQIHFVGISKSQIKSAPKLFTTIVHNGINLKIFPFEPKPKDYLFTAGRIAPEKGIYEAIQVAKKAKEKLVIVGRHTEDAYWHKKIKPYLGGNIKYKGFLPYTEVSSVYKNAKAFVFPLKWEEPFGLMMIEAMACGTPAVAFDRGPVREIIKDKKTGFIVKNISQMVKAIKKIDLIDRRECRKHVEKNFTIEKMVDGYEEVFYKVLSQKKIK